MSETTLCRCGRTIIWARVQGKSIPLDARAHPIYIETAPGQWERAKTARISHFVTCPFAASFSGGSAASKRSSPPGDTEAQSGGSN